MNKMQEQVRDFRSMAEQVIGDIHNPKLQDKNLVCNLITEEARELIYAINGGDLEKTIREICDLLYVTFGAAVAFGINIEPFFDEVHRANMQKASGPKRDDGKREKPEGWQPPDIKGLLSSFRSQNEQTKNSEITS